jgi:molybdenum cofactor cytidylyltransferase
MSVLFEEHPYQFGLRGDVWLWREMQERLRDTSMPESAESLACIVRALFEELTGAALTAPEPFFVPKYSHGGMSSGYVDPRWWREKAIPLLTVRLQDHAES